MLIRMTTALEQELHSASLHSRGRYGVDESAVDSQIWVTVPRSWLVDSTNPEMCGVVFFCEAFENLKFK